MQSLVHDRICSRESVGLCEERVMFATAWSARERH
jgi:hypothetical protein